MLLLQSLWSFLTTTLLSKNIFFIIIGIIGIGFIIAFHELGHLLFCKLFGIKVPSFSIGMGPRLISKKIGSTEYSISAIPLGGYVEIAQASEDGHTSSKEGYFEYKPYWQKMLVMGGGIMFNMIFAYVTFTLLYLSGMPNSPIAYPENARPVISSIVKDSPAQKAGLQIGDRIEAINGAPVGENIQEILKIIAPLGDKKARFAIERQGKHRTVMVTIGQHNGSNAGFLGVGFETQALKPMSLFKAIKQGIKRTNLILRATFSSFKGMFAHRNIEGLGGPIMIISQTIKHAQRGIKIFFMFLAMISINLAILNLIPLPILDGGQALFATMEAIFRRPLSTRFREYVALGTWLIFIVLTLYLSFKDIKFIRNLRNHTVHVEETEK
jgi:regulator of sigma E protease